MKKTGFRFIFVMLMAMFFVLGGFAQDGEATEIVPTAGVSTEVALVEVVESPESIADTAHESAILLDADISWYEELVLWSGWLAAVMFAGVAFFFAKDSAAKGNKMAELGLNFFEASKDMIPFDKFQYNFERMADKTETPIDDIVAAATNAVLNQMGLLNKARAEPAPGGEQPR